MKPESNAGIAAVMVLLLGWEAAAAGAQQVRTLDTTTGVLPWARNVRPEEQAAARELFRKANELLQDSNFAEAAKTYREALDVWNHPAIHYNRALALMPLDQPLEILQHLEAALKHGAEPLGVQKFDYARSYKDLLEKQQVRLVITCDTPGAVVTLDGKPLFVGPNRYEGLVRAGDHTIIATKEGFWPTEKKGPLLPGTREVDLKLYTEKQLTGYRTQWPAWRPWAVAGAGAAFLAGGGLLHLQARDRFTSFDGAINKCGGCVPESTVTARLDDGSNLQKLAYGSYAVGGAVLLTGAVLLFLNQPQSYRMSPDQLEGAASVSAFIGNGSAGATATFHF